LPICGNMPGLPWKNRVIQSGEAHPSRMKRARPICLSPDGLLNLRLIRDGVPTAKLPIMWVLPRKGPFVFSDLAMTGSGQNTWDKYGAHNPTIHKLGDSYVLLYIGNNNPERPTHPSNQHIGMAFSSSLYGPWEKVNGDGLILSPPSDSSFWNYRASNGVNNPALLCHPEGAFYLYFKSEGGMMGLAISRQIQGPYKQFPEPVTSNEQTIEDGYAFLYKDNICLLTTDNHGILEKGGGLLWISDDGLHFNLEEQGFYPVEKYLGKEKLSKASRHYGGKIIKFERPQLLMINKAPAYLYVTSGYHFYGKESTASYVMRFKKAIK